MTNLEKIYPKDTFGLAAIYAITMCLVLFGLSWIDILIVYAIDTVMLVLYRPIDLKTFYTLFPQYREFRDLSKLIEAKKDSFEAQQVFYEELSQFPLRRFVEMFFSSLIKVIPTGLYIAYASKATPTFLENLGLFYIADAFILLYASSLLYIQLHYSTSEVMKELKDKEGWKDNYHDLNLSKVNDRHSYVQNLLLIAMLVNLLWLVIYSIQLETLENNYKLLILFTSAIICIGKVQLLFQKFFRSSLDSIFHVFDQDYRQKKMAMLPLHTFPSIARFEYAFNQLGLKLDEREKEISQWLKHESGQFHLRALGEVTAMVAHDMKTPLHVMSMSLEMMNSENVSPENKKKYLEILERNLGQSISFSKTLMAYVRGNKEEQSCIYGDIHHYLLDLFKTQFNEADLGRIDFKISDEAAKVELKVTRMDAMHIFYNLYQNAIRTVLSDERPSITIKCQIHDEYVIIFLHNSGERLAPEIFYNLISFDRFESDNQFYNGLGLRLTNSILTHLKGSLDIVHVEQGTCLKITLPCETNQKPNFDIDPNNSEETVQ